MPWVIPEYCEGCGSCIAVCKRGCLAFFETDQEGVFIPWIADTDKCTGCGKCAGMCSLGGIAMTGYREDAVKRFESFLKEGRLKPQNSP
jgi:NAD-dependent dihydropyrimidine dehydrogenase PreA subunit